MKRVLVTYGSKRGGTAEIANRIAETLRNLQVDVDCVRASEVRDVAPYDAVIVGGALYALRWAREAKRFIARHAAVLRARPVWMFSSGPLDGSASQRVIPPVGSVVSAMAKIGARGHMTFGGRLAPDATGFPASAMARTHAGDWRDWQQIERWSAAIAADVARGVPVTEMHTVSLPVPSTESRRWLLVLACLLVGLPAIVGGLWFRVPALLVVGVADTVAAALVLAQARWGHLVALAGALALIALTVTEMWIMHAVSWFEVAAILLALITIAEAQRLRIHRESRFIHALAR